VLAPVTLAALPSTRAIPIATCSMSLIPFASFSVFLRVLRGKTCDHLVMSTRQEIDEELASDAPDERFNGAELSESVLGRDWNSPEEDPAWSNL
jgi:hypothetical protein